MHILGEIANIYAHEYLAYWGQQKNMQSKHNQLFQVIPSDAHWSYKLKWSWNFCTETHKKLQIYMLKGIEWMDCRIELLYLRRERCSWTRRKNREKDRVN